MNLNDEQMSFITFIGCVVQELEIKRYMQLPPNIFFYDFLIRKYLKMENKKSWQFLFLFLQHLF